ncbi:YqaJ viral recombinase family protein [Patescibacteria group bacterium]|nr:YqaJ viral recombinase family protein [Patescibacteria group bacterium]
MKNFKSCRIDPGAYDIEMHKTVISCSDIGRVLGLDPYCTRRHLLEAKAEQKSVLDPSRLENDPFLRTCLAFGREMEPVARMWYTTTFMKPVSLLSMRPYTQNPRICGTIDGIDSDDTILEIKWRCYPNCLFAEPFEHVPYKYYLQLQGYLNLYEKENGVLLSCTLRNGTNIFKVTRDRSLWSNVVFALENFISAWDQASFLLRSGLQSVYKKFIHAYLMSKKDKDANTELVKMSMEKHCERPVHFC